MKLTYHLLPLLLLSALPATDHRLSAYGALPNDNIDDTAALRQALSQLANGDRLIFSAGQYDLFLAPGELPAVFQLNNGRNISLVGNGAVLMLHKFDIVSPGSYPDGGLFVFVDCHDVAVDGLTVDMARAPFSNGTVVTSVTNNGSRIVEVQFDPEFPVSTSMHVEAFHRHTPGGLPWGKGCDLYLGSQPAITQPTSDPQRLRITLPGTPTGAPIIGLYEKASVRHRVYGYNALHLLRCAGASITNVTVHTVPGMGIFAAGCSDVTVSGFQVLKKPASQRLWSTTADATHFVATSGSLNLSNNLFEAMGDDGFNVHGVYSLVVNPVGPNVVRLGPPTTSSQFMMYKPGDVIEFCDGGSLVPVATAVVQSSAPVGTTQHDVVLTSPAPSLPAGAFATNLTRIPTVSILGTTSRNHRGRGFVIQARNVTVDGCTMTGCTGPGITVTCDGTFFYESIGTRAVTIRNCTLEGVNNGWIGSNGAHLAAIYVFADTSGGLGQAGLHDGINIQGNMIRNTNYSAIHIGSTANAWITGNTFDNVCKSTSPFPVASQGYVVWFANANTATVTSNTRVNGVRPGWGMTNSTGISVFGNTGL